MNIAKTNKTCYVTAAADIDTGPLMKLFKDRQINAQRIQYSTNQFNVMTGYISEIAKADFVCGILGRQPSDQVLFEIGFALGRKKPIFLIVAENEFLPDLTAVFVVRAEPSDIEAIAFNLDQFLLHAFRKKSSPLEASLTPKELANSEKVGLVHWAENLVSLPVQSRYIELEKVVREIFSKIGRAVPEKQVENFVRGNIRGADLAVWLENAKPILGNPWLVEIKTGRLSENILSKVQMQLRKFLIDSNARGGLLVYYDNSGKRFPSTSIGYPPIFRFELFELIDLVNSEQFEKQLLKQRNKAYHGKHKDG